MHLYIYSSAMQAFLTARFVPSAAGLVSEPTRQMEEAQEDHQRVSHSRHFAAHSPRPTAVPLRRGGRGSHGRQPVLFSREWHPLGVGRDAGSLPAAVTARPRPTTSHGTVSIPVQPGRRTAAQLHEPVQHVLHVLQRLRPPVPPLPTHLPRYGARVALWPHQRDRLASAV